MIAGLVEWRYSVVITTRITARTATPILLFYYFYYSRTITWTNRIIARITREHGPPKIHKHFDDLLLFRSRVDATGTRHYSAGKYLPELVNSLTQNEYSLKDLFDAANKINRISPLVQENEEYMFVSRDEVSLLTNVPLRRTVNTILKQRCNEKLINTSLSKHSLKKLILDTCQKTTLSFNSKLYEQIHGVSMGGSLGPALSNIIMTKCKKVIVDRLRNYYVLC